MTELRQQLLSDPKARAECAVAHSVRTICHARGGCRRRGLSRQSRGRLGHRPYACRRRRADRTVTARLFERFADLEFGCSRHGTTIIVSVPSAANVPCAPHSAPADLAFGGSGHANTTNSCPARSAGKGDLRGHAVQLIKRCGRQRLRRRCNDYGQGSNSDQPDHRFPPAFELLELITAYFGRLTLAEVQKANYTLRRIDDIGPRSNRKAPRKERGQLAIAGAISAAVSAAYRPARASACAGCARASRRSTA